MQFHKDLILFPKNSCALITKIDCFTVHKIKHNAYYVPFHWAQKFKITEAKKSYKNLHKSSASQTEVNGKTLQ